MNSPDASATPPIPVSPSRMRRLLQRLLAVLLLLPLTLLLLIALLPGSEPGSRWLLSWIPGLQVSEFSGDLLHGWSARQLVWSDGQTRIQLEQPELQLVPACLAQRRLCLPRLQVQQLSLDLPPASHEAPDSGPLILPAIQLPLGIQLDSLQLGRLQLNGQPLLHDLQLTARLEPDGRLQIQPLHVQLDSLPGWQLQLTNLQLQLQAQWPVQARLQAQGPAPDGQASWQLAAEIQGELGKTLQLQLNSEGWLQAALEGNIQPLAAALPAQLQGRLQVQRWPWSLPAELQPQAIELQLDGQLDSGYDLQLQTRLGAASPLPLTLRTRVQADRLQLQVLQLQDGAGQSLQLSGDLDWSGPLASQLQLQAGAFPWQRLSAAIPPDLQLRNLQGRFQLQGQDYSGQLQLALDTPQGPVSLSTPLQGNFQQLQLPALQVQASSSQLNSQIQLRFADLQWQAAVQAQNFNPQPWLAELPGRIAGQLRASGTPEQLSAEWQLDGQLRQQALQTTGQLQLQLADLRLQLNNLLLRLGNNRIQGQARLDQQLAADLQLQLPQLDQLWPQLRGRLQGNLHLQGSRSAPAGELQLSGQAALGSQRIGQLQLQARLAADQRGELQLKARDLTLNGQSWPGVQLLLNGNRNQHRLQLEADAGRQGRAQLQLTGALGADLSWQGRLEQGRITVAGMDWQQQSAASLQYQPDGRVELGAHCWSQDSTRLCAGVQRLWPQPRIALRLQSLPLARLTGTLPAGTQVDGQLNGEVQLEMTERGPQGQLWLDAGTGSLQLAPAPGKRGESRSVPPLVWQQWRLDTRLQPQQVSSQLRLSGPQLGELQADLRLDPRSQRLQAGSFRFAALDLALLRPLLGDELQIDGHLQGAGELSGSLAAPVINGQVSLQDAQVRGSSLPMDMQDLQLNLQIQGQQARLDGQWRSGKRGTGQIQGDLQWQPQAQASLRITGRHLPAHVEPYAELEVEPDLLLSLQDGQLKVSGELAVPRGQIEVRQLPEHTVGLSSDARVLGREQEGGEGGSLPLATDVLLKIGSDHLSFSGFGLNALLRGELRLRDNLETRGSLQLDEGRFKAYGQNLTLRRARLLFAGPLDRPQLDIEAIRTVDEQIAGLRLSGPADAPVSEVFSEPQLSQEESLSWLVLGRAPGSQDDQSALSRAALALGLAGGSPVASGLASRLGVRDFQLESSGSGLTTSVVASGYLTSRLSLRYGVSMFQPANTLALRYDLSKRLYLEAASGVASSLDIFYRKDY